MAFSRINDTTFEAELGDRRAKQAHARVRVGDETNLTEFRPHIKAGKWDDEAWLSLELQLPPSLSADRFRNTNDSLLELEGQHFAFRTYELNDDVLEIELEFRRKPPRNYVEFRIEKAPGIELYYQGPLGPDDGLEIDGQWVPSERPPRVVGSYAVYLRGRGKALGKYKGGKVAHIYSWLAHDANDNEISIPLKYDETTGLLRIEVPQDWLDNAAYPVTLIGNGDTIGFASCGGSAQSVGAGWLWATGDTDGGYDVGAAGTYNVDGWGNSCDDGGQATAPFKPAIYEDDGSGGVDGGTRHSYDDEYDAHLQANTCRDNSTPCTLADFPGYGSTTIDGNTKYWVAFLTGNAEYDLKYDSVASYRNRYKTGQTYANPPADPFPSSPTAWDGRQVTAFIEYSAAAADLEIDSTESITATDDATVIDAVAYDAASSASAENASSLSWQHTCTGNNRVLAVGVAVSPGSVTVSGVTYGVSPMTQGDRQAGTNVSSELWYLVAPSTGENTVVVTLSGAADSVRGGAVSFRNAKQSSPLNTVSKATGSGTSSSLDVASDGDDMVVDILGRFGAGEASPNTGQTERWQEN